MQEVLLAARRMEMQERKKILLMESGSKKSRQAQRWRLRKAAWAVVPAEHRQMIRVDTFPLHQVSDKKIER